MTTDPDWDDVVLRCTFDTDFSDVSDSGHTISSVGSAGPAVVASGGQFDGYVDLGTFDYRLEAPNSADFLFGAGDFTVEYWVRYPVGQIYTHDHISVYDRSGNQRAWTVGASSSRVLHAFCSSNGTGADLFNVASGGSAIPLDTWMHICLERAGNVWRLYRDGAMVAKNTASGTMHASTTALRINSGLAINDTSTGRVYFDDVRITKGLARHNSDSGYTVPTAAYPVMGNSGTVDAGPGELSYTGQAPFVIGVEFVEPGAGSFAYSGQTVDVLVQGTVLAGAGTLTYTGQDAELLVGITVSPGAGELSYSGQAPFVSTEFFVAATQSAVLMLAAPEYEVRASQSAVLMIGEVVPDVKATQSAILILVDAQPCVSRRADIWVIERRDGERLAFTGHDVAIPFGDLTATPCGSLSPTATEQASEISGVGNMELAGLITSDLITEADLYAGLYDDAFVEVWRVSWDEDIPETPVRMAAGWWGNLRHGSEGFSAEILGPGARIQQQALVQMVTPGCRRDFGSAQSALPPGGCGVDREAYLVQGEITFVRNRGRFTASLGAATAPQYANGLARWLTGPNAGTSTEVKTVDFGTGQIDLWIPTSFLPNVGDTFELLPGCDKLPETCKLYSNYVNFGGFPDVPGTDAISETPDAKL